MLQIRGSQIIDAVRLHKVGFPKHIALGEFRRRFSLLSSDVNTRPGSPVADERRAVEDMMLTIDVDPALYRVGQSQVSYIYYFAFFSILSSSMVPKKCDIPREDIYKISLYLYCFLNKYMYLVCTRNL